MKVVWVNDDGEVHTVTSDDGAFDSGDILPGANFSLVFSEIKNYNYHCKYHTNEHSIISVK
jgi:plastocyanin